jgi:hypothetical protein
MNWFLDRWRVRKHWKLRFATQVVAFGVAAVAASRSDSSTAAVALVVILLTLLPYWRSDKLAERSRKARATGIDPGSP